MNSLRDDTLGYVEERRDEVQSDHENAKLLIIYEMSKDAFLESLTEDLIDAVKRQDFERISKIEHKVKAYANSPSYKKRVAEKIANQISHKEAELYLRKEA